MSVIRAAAAPSRQLHLPRPERVRLHRFSLFERRTTVEVSFERGVTCLAGANGLGKSTFLAALNYGMTGVVAEPGREFRGVEDYYRKVRAYTESYFHGRIAPEDAEAAQVEVEMRVHRNRYRITRGLFDPLELRRLEIRRAADNSLLLEDDSELDPADRHEVYATKVCEDAGLENLAQLSFLQHFVLTFDERRQLLFWGPRLLPAALFIAFGLDAAKARRADKLQEIVRGADSLARNYSWQASDWRRQLDNLEKASDEVVAEDDGIGAEHLRLLEEQEETAKTEQRLTDQLTSLRTAIATRSAQLRADRESYDEVWRERLSGRGHPANHPVVTTTLDAGRCAICGTESESVGSAIRERLQAQTCPLCGSALKEDQPAVELDVSELSVLDERILAHQVAIAAAENEVAELHARLQKSRDELNVIAAKLSDFEQSNELALLRGRGELDAVAERYRSAMAEQLSRKEEQLERRDKAQQELRVLQRELVGAYSVAEDRFVPAFTRLAQEFLGLDLDVELEARKNSVRLLLRLRGEARQTDDDLSESQRFFVAIALRMALIGQMASGDAGGVLYVDTPEGSLDIAYEARAGDMFGTFVRDGFGIVMTANINTSKLLERLARKCGRQLMRLERMTDWSVLSEVQAAEEGLFTDAYDQIDAALQGSNA